MFAPRGRFQAGRQTGFPFDPPPKVHLLPSLETSFQLDMHLVLWQRREGCNDGRQGNLALLGQVRRAGEGVGGAAQEPGAGVTYRQGGKNQPSVGSVCGKAALASVPPVGGLTLVLDGEVGGDQGWNLASDIGGVDLRAVSVLVLLNHLGLHNNSGFRVQVPRRSRAPPEAASAPLTVLGMESGSSFFCAGPASPPGAPGKAPGIPCWGPAMGPPKWPVRESRGGGSAFSTKQQLPDWLSRFTLLPAGWG